jgi:LCP family protein required for cell wall assembly
MVLMISPRNHRGAIVSIPRDLRVEIPGHRADKINHSYAFGGSDLSRRTVEGVLGVPIPYYIRCDFATFVKAADLLGGVDVEVHDVEGKGRGMNYDDNWGNLHIHLTPGWHHLNGYEAMGFVRYRHGDTDTMRTKRQQQFMRAVLEQKVRVTNLPSLLRAGSVVLRELDTNASWRDAVDLLRVGKGMSSTDLLTETIAIRDEKIGGIYYAGLLEDQFRELTAKVDAHLSGQGAGEAALVVLNATGVQGVAYRATRRLEHVGWTVARTGTAEGGQEEATRIEYPEGAQATADRLAHDLGLPGVQVVPAQPGQAELRVVLGRDYTDHGNHKGG